MMQKRTLVTAATAIAAIGFFQQAGVFATAPPARSSLPGFAEAVPQRMDANARMPEASRNGSEYTPLDRAFELYADRGRLNMRRGLDVTIETDAGETSVDPSGAVECDLLKAAFASKCVVLAANTAIRRAAAHRVALSLAFQENVGAGEWSRPDREHFRTVRQPIAAVAPTGNDHAAARATIYRQLGALCATVSPRGHCSLLAGKISLEARQGHLKATGEAILGVVDETGATR